ncbi:MAG: LPS-assembly protein LptD [Deltaproteobacteria bacterium]|nr:LPS-assembly protein LptD [Deltaproteobacteria bacterium]
MDITADYLTYDKDTDTYHAEGNVIIVQGPMILKTDSAMLNTYSGVASARGNVVAVDEGGNTLQGDNLTMNLREKTAVVARGRIFFKKEHVHISGDPITKTGEVTYKLNRATFTTCDCEEGESPAWSFYLSRGEVTIGEFLTGRNAFFYIKRVPVFYSPYVSVPIKRERQTGFLQPKPGYSKLRGFVFRDAFFWAISQNTDATFHLDYESIRGVGEGAEFRYIRTRQSSGVMFYDHFHENDINRVREFRKGVNNLSRPLSASSERWFYRLLHSEYFKDGTNIRANINLVSDDEYFIDFGKDTKDRSQESLESNVSISKNWSVYSLVAQWRFFNNLLVQDDSTTLQKLPEITFSGTDTRVFVTPFYISFDTSLVNFSRKQGITGQRLDIHPRLSLPLNPGGYFDLTPSFSPRATFYMVSEDPRGRFFDRYLYEAKVDLTTTFVRVFDTEFERLRALRHTIRPKLTYTYVPEAVQSDLPQFDGLDSIGATNGVTYSLNSTVTGKFMEDGKKSYLDYFYLDIAQTFNINEATRKLTSVSDKRRPFTNITGEARLMPAKWAAVSAKGNYNYYMHWFDSYDASLGIADERGDKLNVTERFLRATSKYLEASARARVIKPLDLTYLTRFSFDRKKPLETVYGIEYTHQCWSAVLTYTERLEEKIIFLTFSLQGLGKVAGVQGAMPSSF